jgi:hypothetical protein
MGGVLNRGGQHHQLWHNWLDASNSDIWRGYSGWNLGFG